MTFQEYIQSLQDQLDRDGGHPDTEDVCEAISFHGHFRPEFPSYSFQISMVEAWFGVKHAVKEAELIKGRDIGLSEKFVPLVEKGNALEKKILGYWDQVKDQPILDLREASEEDPTSKTRMLYDAFCAFDKECREFETVVAQEVREANVISGHYSRIRGSHDESFTKQDLQSAIDRLVEQGAKRNQKMLTAELKISVNTFKKYLRELGVTKADLKSALRGEFRLE